MRHGDLSNRGGTKLAFRMEDCILKKNTQNGFISKLASNFNSLYGYEPDKNVLTSIDNIFRGTDINVICVVHRNNLDKKVVKNVLENWVGDVFVFDKISEIITALNCKDFEYYIDNNQHRLDIMAVDGAVTFKEFREKCMRV